MLLKIFLDAKTGRVTVVFDPAYAERFGAGSIEYLSAEDFQDAAKTAAEWEVHADQWAIVTAAVKAQPATAVAADLLSAVVEKP